MNAAVEEDDGVDDRYEFRAQIFVENASGVSVSTSCFSPNSNLVLIATIDSEITVWDCCTDEASMHID